MNKFVAASVASLLAQTAFASGYDTPDQAAIAALNSITTKHQEQAGVIYQLDNQYYHSEPKGSKLGASVSIEVTMPSGAKFVGIYHNHPEGNSMETSDSKYFSCGDVQFANERKLISWIKVSANSSIKRYTPGVSRTKLFGSGLLKCRVSLGETIYTLTASN